MSNQNINLNGNLMRIRDNGDGSYSTTTSAYVQYAIAHNALAITDTVAHDSALQDATAWQDLAVWVDNTLNQQVTVQVLLYNPVSTFYYVLPNSKTVVAGASAYICATDIPQLSCPFTKFKIRVTAAVAPSSGTITTYVMGD